MALHKNPAEPGLPKDGEDVIFLDTDSMEMTSLRVEPTEIDRLS